MAGNVEAQVAVIRQSQHPEFDAKPIVGQARLSQKLVLVVYNLELNCFAALGRLPKIATCYLQRLDPYRSRH